VGVLVNMGGKDDRVPAVGAIILHRRIHDLRCDAAPLNGRRQCPE
jgi:hypothetical protein